MNTTIATFVETLLESRVLDPAQQEEFSREGLARLGDLAALTDELLRRGWLTHFQLAELERGRGHGLVRGQYLLLESLGEGGMGRVFKARHRRMKRVVALKFIHKHLLTDPRAVQRFYREIEAVARLSHPNIVMAFDADEIDGTHFFVTEYVEGVDLRTLLERDGPMPVAQACEATRQAALGLQHAHLRGLVHRDIKPANLLLSREGLVKIVDLGLARLSLPDRDGPGAVKLTRTGEVMGTPDYLAPEQIADFHRADIRADIYSLGCTLYQLLTGQPPFAGRSLAEKLLVQRRGDPPEITALRSDLPSGLAVVIRTMMARRPEHRFPTPAEVAAALEPFGRTIAAAPEVPPSEPGRTPEGSHSLGPPERYETWVPGAELSRPEAERPTPRAAPVHRPRVSTDAGGPHKRRALVAGTLALALIGLSVWGLWASRGTEQGTVFVQVMEPGVNARVDERLIPIDAGRVGHLALDPGDHTLRIWRGDEVLFEKPFTLKSGGQETIVARWRTRNPGTPGPVRPSQLETAHVASPRGTPGPMITRDQAGRSDPGLVRAILDRGRARLSARDAAGALTDANEAIRLEPRLAEAYILRATAANDSNQLRRAIADATEAVQLDPGSSEAYAQRALAYNNVGKHDQALADSNEALRLDPKSVLAYTQRAWIYLHRGDPDRAIADYSAALRLDPKLAWVFEHRARAYIIKGEPERVIADCTEAVRIDPNLAFAYLKRGVAYARLGDFKRALADANEAIRLEPQLAGAHRLRGDVCTKEGNLDRAIASYSEAIRLDPRSVASYRGRAEAHSRKGERDRAEADRREAERLKSSMAR